MGFHVTRGGYRGIMTQPAITEYTVEVHDLGHVSPNDSTPEQNRLILLRHGWMETGGRLKGFTDTRRLFWYRHGDVWLVMDDTSLLAVFTPLHARRQDMKVIQPTIASLKDWRKSTGTKRLAELKQSSHETAVACREMDLSQTVADMVMNMLAGQNDLLGVEVYQHPVRYGGWKDLLLQRSRIARCRTSMLADQDDPRWERLDRQLDAYEAYMDACYLNGDRMSRMAGLSLAAIFSSTGIISLFLNQHWDWRIMLTCVVIVFGIFLFSLPRKLT